MKWINLTLFLITLVPVWDMQALAYIFVAISLFLSLALSNYSIYDKHKGAEHARAKTFKEVGVMVLTLVLISFLGGIVALLANAQVRVRWGEVAGLVSALG